MWLQTLNAQQWSTINVAYSQDNVQCRYIQHCTIYDYMPHCTMSDYMPQNTSQKLGCWPQWIPLIHQHLSTKWNMEHHLHRQLLRFSGLRVCLAFRVSKRLLLKNRVVKVQVFRDVTCVQLVPNLKEQDSRRNLETNYNKTRIMSKSTITRIGKWKSNPNPSPIAKKKRKRNMP